MSHILVVDDDETARRLVAQALTRPHRTIHVAAHGEEALEQVAKATPDLVISDVVMPRMNGWALVRRLRTTHATSFIPVILMTSLDSEHDRVRGFRLGADDFLSKPVSFEELELRVENVLHRSRTHHTKTALLDAALAGHLAQFGLATLLTVLDLERKTGILTLEHERRRGIIVLREGRVVDARVDEAPRGDVAHGIFELLSWSEGSFAFEEQPVETKDSVGLTTSMLLLDAARRMDELVPVECEDEAIS